MNNQNQYHVVATSVSPCTPVDTTELAHVSSMHELYRWLIDHQLYCQVKTMLAPQVHIMGDHWCGNRHVITNAHNAAQMVSFSLRELAN